jgi:hypothetical protein
MTKKIIALSGFMNSGKDTVANFLVRERNFRKVSFADSLKDCVASVFHWDRKLLQGDSKESRQWREEEDTYWTNKLGIRITPRYVLQFVGTELFRNVLSPNIWVFSAEKKIIESTQDIVISDARFTEELNLVRNLNGNCYFVSRKSSFPAWKEKIDCMDNIEEKVNFLTTNNIHQSEWQWYLDKSNEEIDNNVTIAELYKNLSSIF